ncbi:MAG TPA: hypothetical protein VEL51_21875 [Vicinamibacterales bacterium]|nr:hypothetical protein [Vicinamibacterales bacterium]
MIIRRVGVWSVARLYGGISATMGLIIGACFALAATLGGMANAIAASDSGLRSSGLGALFGVGAIIILPIMYGVIGLIGGAIGAALYNLFAGMFGGIELEIQQ